MTAMDCNAPPPPRPSALPPRRGSTPSGTIISIFRPTRWRASICVYADGFLGHVFDGISGLEPFFDKLAGARSRSRRPSRHLQRLRRWTRLTASRRIRASMISGSLSRSYLREALAMRGFECLEAYLFPIHASAERITKPHHLRRGVPATPSGDAEVMPIPVSFSEAADAASCPISWKLTGDAISYLRRGGNPRQSPDDLRRIRGSSDAQYFAVKHCRTRRFSKRSSHKEADWIAPRLMN